MANPFILFHHKLKKVKVALVQWSFHTSGNIFLEIKTLEGVIKVHEVQFEIMPTPMPTLEEVKEEVFKLMVKVLQGQMVSPVSFINLVGKSLRKIFITWSIVENIILTQEIISEIRLRAKEANIVKKLDMEKAYDRVSWLFFTKVLRKIGFSEALIDMIYRIVGNNWYSVLVNGQQHGFFQSSRGVKQGDPLSPTLFIIAAKVLSRNLNHLHVVPEFKGFGMPKWRPKINHLAYADDIIIFTSADVPFMLLIMEILGNYEKTSGRKINKEKSVVYMHENVSAEISITVKIVTGIVRKDFPFGWKGKMLSVGGREILIKHVLQSMPMHLLSTVNPPDGVIRQMHKMFAQFFWSNTIGGKSRHWVAWTKMCIPTAEEGLGFRSLHDVSLSLYCKLWWNFRPKASLWSAFLTNKYYRKENVVIIPWKYGSQNWKKMLMARDMVENQIWWQIKQGNSLFWYDKWTGMGALYFMCEEDNRDPNVQNVYDLVENGTWNLVKLREMIPEDIVQHIMDNIMPPVEDKEEDKPWCLLSTNGEFSVKSAWEFVRLRGQEMDKLPLDDVLRKMGYNLVSQCINMEGLQLQQLILTWWMAPVSGTLKEIFREVSSIIIWELWKRRNCIKHRETRSEGRVICQVYSTIQKIVQLWNPSLHNIPNKWGELIRLMESKRAKLKITKVLWDFPPTGWIICNTDGASRGNPGISSHAFCLRDELGDL
ncbi:uncharacterized protein LOC132601460 [Lycium barbarum]|uniref:uncharacterized protein LOC132601460 n=1 Tax=Lycium barbarum TaxID=112863 RepID=UPI00293EC4B3|nr:uncharacterized protein LOC132601460 [Lycium barbarum]